MAVPQTTLAAAIATTNVTTASVSDVLGFALSSDTSDLVLVDSEFMLVSGGLGTTSWTGITRGYASSTAATHLIGATVTRIARGYTDLTRVKTQASILTSDTTDDSALLTYIDAVTGEFNRRIGMFLGPSTDTVRLYDGYAARRNGYRLWIPGGIRALTGVRIASSTGGTLTAATLADFVLRPHAHERRPGQPATRIDITDVASACFYPGYENIEITAGASGFGYAAVPDDLAKLGDMVVLRMWEDRNAGGATAPTPSKFIFGSDAEMLETYRRETFPAVAG